MNNPNVPQMMMARSRFVIFYLLWFPARPGAVAAAVPSLSAVEYDTRFVTFTGAATLGTDCCYEDEST